MSTKYLRNLDLILVAVVTIFVVSLIIWLGLT